jgi:hypothetical protein
LGVNQKIEQTPCRNEEGTKTFLHRRHAAAYQPFNNFLPVVYPSTVSMHAVQPFTMPVLDVKIMSSVISWNKVQM